LHILKRARIATHWRQTILNVQLLIKLIQQVIFVETLHFHPPIPFTIMGVHVFPLIVNLSLMD